MVLNNFEHMFFPEFKEFGTPEFLFVLICIALCFYIINYLINYLPVSSLKTIHLKGNPSFEPVSVVICAKNEDENLTEFLPKVLTQDFPEFEVIVVNDCSWDNTENVIDEFAKIFPNLKKVNIKEDAYYKHGKKFAILVGIKAAKHNRLVFIDADCYPESNKWLQHMADGFTSEKEIVLGYGAYEKQAGLLNTLIRFDALIIAINYLSAAIKQKAYMGVGRNLAYSKELFFRNKGFATHYHIQSGDDDLFVNEASTTDNVNVCISKEAVTYSKPKKTFKDWRIQKARHLTTAPFYKSETKSKLAFNYFTQYFFYISLLAQAGSIQTVLLIPVFFILKSIVQLLVLNKSFTKFGEKDLLWQAIIIEFLFLFIYPIFQVSKLFHKPGKWSH